MAPTLVIATTSPTRLALLTAAGIAFTAVPHRVDEGAIRAALEAEGAHPRDIADTLAEQKAAKIAAKRPDAVVIGADQVADLDGRVLSKPGTADALRAQLRALRGRDHRLFSAVVVYQEGRPVWRHMGEVRLTMRAVSDAFLEGYVARNPDAQACAGGYQIEGEGMRLFDSIEGSYFDVLGLPLLPLVGYLTKRGWIDG